MDKIIVNEVGLRDGLQNEQVVIDTDGKLKLVRSLVNAGITSIEVASFVSPRLVPQMADASELYKKLPAKNEVFYSVLVPNVKGYERAVQAGARCVGVVLSATDTMNRKNINMSLEQAKAACIDVTKMARNQGLAVRSYISVAFACPFEGPTPSDLVMKLVNEMFEAGVNEVVIADTIGAANPKQTSLLFAEMASRFDLSRISAHFHDTRALAMANVWSALQAGIRKFDSSVGGLGGCPFSKMAAGNLATEDLVTMLHQCGYETGIDVPGLLETVKIAGKLLGRRLGGRVMPWLESSGCAATFS